MQEIEEDRAVLRASDSLGIDNISLLDYSNTDTFPKGKFKDIVPQLLLLAQPLPHNPVGGYYTN